MLLHPKSSCLPSHAQSHFPARRPGLHPHLPETPRLFDARNPFPASLPPCPPPIPMPAHFPGRPRLFEIRHPLTFCANRSDDSVFW
jgi:hypothetical protein